MTSGDSLMVLFSLETTPSIWEQMERGCCFCCSIAQSCLTLWPHGLQHARLPCRSLSPRLCSNSCRLNQWCHPTISSSVVPFSSCLHLCKHQGLFQWVSSSYQVAKVVELCFGINPSNEYLGLISFKIDCFYLLAVQGTLRSLLQHHNSNTSILWHSAFFTVQLLHLYMTTRKTIALII